MKKIDIKGDSSASHTLLQTFQSAFIYKKNPFPWRKAICAGLASSLPILLGLLFGHMKLGLAAGMGGFAYLYVFNQPYAQRAKMLFLIVAGLALSMALGILLAPYPLGMAIGLGITGAVGIFIFGALRITGPSAIFFVLCFAIASGIPATPADAPIRGGLVFLGGTLSWLIAMAGWFINPHGPETAAVKKVYTQLAGFAANTGQESIAGEQHKTVAALKEAEEILLAGYSFWTNSELYKRLYLLNDHANRLFLELLELSREGNSLPAEVGQSLLAIAEAIGSRKKNMEKILQPDRADERIAGLFSEIYDADAILNEPIEKINRTVKIAKPSIKTLLLGAFDKNSIVFLSALRYGLVLLFATLLAHALPVERSYWIPLSCGSVMLGSTIIATYHRAIQRTFGTIAGLIIASLLLMNIQNGYMVAAAIFALTFLTEMFIVRNYAIAVVFITPSALLIAEYSTNIHDFTFFATARAENIIIGSLIGLFGVFLFGRKAASGRLNHFLAKTIRSQGQYLVALFSERNGNMSFHESRESRKMHINLVNLSTVYVTALGENAARKKQLESLWPAIFSIEMLGYYLDSALKYDKRAALSDDVLAQLLYTFETMARSAEQNIPVGQREIPEMKGFEKIRNEILSLQKSLSFGEKTV
ncbi:FUSC family protein [Bacillus sp. B-jedd]|uniref:FUSC family protein n=1 Tax=Bacillus sp. B-jedd TaxID=1476857 RepID=UPI00051565FF|nr:FUSC family protein [Bacillus sp. B-jedd]CEG25804.1 inner membrane protein yccS [Bacillus sp. B-jedd]